MREACLIIKAIVGGSGFILFSKLSVTLLFLFFIMFANASAMFKPPVPNTSGFEIELKHTFTSLVT